MRTYQISSMLVANSPYERELPNFRTIGRKSILDGIRKRQLTTIRVYKDAVFDTNRKSLLRHISAEKGLK